MTKLEDLTNSVDSLVTAISDQSDLLSELPNISFKVKILWNVFCTICGLILVGIVTWIGAVIVNYIQSGGGV